MSNMKTLIIVLSILTLILTACDAASTPTEEAVIVEDATLVAEIVSTTQTASAPAATVTATSSSAALTTDYADAASVEMQLLVGILKLEGTDLAITSSQATSLITLLNSLKELTMNNTTSQEQVDSIVQQVQSILSAEQVTAIAGLQITQESAMTILQELGFGMRGPQQGGGNPPQGEMPQGAPPSGTQGGNGQPPDASQMGTPPADGMQPGIGMIPPQLIDMLIQVLETKVSS